jgi:HEAT repeat protein
MLKIMRILILVSSRRTFLQVAGLICLCAVGVGAWHISTPQVSDKTKVRERITVLIREALKEGEGSVDGIKTWSRVPPSTKTIEEIQAYGDDSVPVLTKFLDSDNERERAIAVDFLGRLGGRRIIIPLRNVIRYDASRSIRLQALAWISLAPWEFASAVVREAMDTDPDPKVREAAKDILNNHSSE